MKAFRIMHSLLVLFISATGAVFVGKTNCSPHSTATWLRGVHICLSLQMLD